MNCMIVFATAIDRPRFLIDFLVNSQITVVKWESIQIPHLPVPSVTLRIKISQNQLSNNKLWSWLGWHEIEYRKANFFRLSSYLFHAIRDLKEETAVKLLKFIQPRFHLNRYLPVHRRVFLTASSCLRSSCTKVFGTHTIYEGGGVEPTPHDFENGKLYNLQLWQAIRLSMRGKKLVELMI